MNKTSSSSKGGPSRDDGIQKWTGAAIKYKDTTIQCKHKSPILPNGAFRALIIGASGGGKSRCVLNILPQINDALRYVIVASCVHQNQMHDAIEEWCANRDPIIWYVKCSTPEIAKQNIEAMVNTKSPSELGLIIFDDFTAMVGNPSHSNDPYTVTIAKSFSLLRNYGIAMIAISQFWFNVPQRVTTSANLMFVFASSSIYSLMGVQAATSTIYMGKRWSFMDAYQKYIDGRSPFNYFIISTNPPRIHCIDFSGDETGAVIDVVSEMDGESPSKVRGGVRGETGKGTQKNGDREERVDGEIGAGNNAPELHISKLGTIARNSPGSSKGKRARDLAMAVARNGGVDRETYERLMKGGL